MQQMGYDLIFLEESAQFDPTLFSIPMQKSGYTVISILMGPWHIGWPTGGCRFFACAIKPERFVWLGHLAPEDILKDFLKVFGRRVMTSGSVFCGLDTDENIRDTRERVAECPLIDKPLVQILPPGKRERFLKGVEIAKQKRGIWDNNVFVDMSQVSRNVVSPFMPRATKSSQLVMVDVTQSPSDMLGHVVTPAEMSFSMGVPSVDIPESAADLWRSRFETGVFDLTAACQIKLNGNAISAPMLFAWNTYVLMNIVDRERLMAWQP